MLQADAKTNRFRDKVLKKGGVWRDIYGIDEKKVASMVREDSVDILVELTGHTANNKLGMMACRPAPIQVIIIVSLRYVPFQFKLLWMKCELLLWVVLLQDKPILWLDHLKSCITWIIYIPSVTYVDT